MNNNSAFCSNVLSEATDGLNFIKQKINDNAVIAGGAMRDLYFGKLPTDYDVFIPVPKQTFDRLTANNIKTELLTSVSQLTLTEEVFAKSLMEQPINEKCNYNNGYCSTSTSSNPKNLKFKVFNGWFGLVPFQLIYITTTVQYHINNDFIVNFSKAYYDGHRVRYTKQFLSDALNKTITVSRPFAHEKEAMHVTEYYLPKIKAKFPDFTVQMSEENKQMAFDAYLHQQLKTF